MERRTDDEPVSAIQKRIERQNLIGRNQSNQQCDNILPDTFVLEESIKKHEKNDINLHDLIDEISNPKLTTQSFLFEAKNDMDGRLVETFMPPKDFEAYEIYLEYIKEKYDERSIIVQQEMFLKKQKKIFGKVRRNEMVKELI